MKEIKEFLQKNILSDKGRIRTTRLKKEFFIKENKLYFFQKIKKYCYWTNSPENLLSEEVHSILNDFEAPICPNCSKICNFDTCRKKYYKHCSKSCIIESGALKKGHKKYSKNKDKIDAMIKKAQNTKIEKYGSIHLDEWVKKAENSSLKNNGFKYSLQTKEGLEKK